jgi:hypothetical protein
MSCVVLQYFLSCSHWTRRFRQFFVQSGDTFKARRIFVAVRPLDEQNFALLSDLWICNIVSSEDTESLKERLVRESTLETRSRVLD